MIKHFFGALQKTFSYVAEICANNVIAQNLMKII